MLRIMPSALARMKERKNLLSERARLAGLNWHHSKNVQMKAAASEPDFRARLAAAEAEAKTELEAKAAAEMGRVMTRPQLSTHQPQEGKLQHAKAHELKNAISLPMDKEAGGVSMRSYAGNARGALASEPAAEGPVDEWSGGALFRARTTATSTGGSLSRGTAADEGNAKGALVNLPTDKSWAQPTGSLGVLFRADTAGDKGNANGPLASLHGDKSWAQPTNDNGWAQPTKDNSWAASVKDNGWAAVKKQTGWASAVHDNGWASSPTRYHQSSPLPARRAK